MSMSLPQALVLRQVQLLEGPGQALRRTDVRLEQGRIVSWGEGCLDQSTPEMEASGLLLAPALVDPHSCLDDPQNGVAETRVSLERSAIAAGYGTVAVLPDSCQWRDSPERLQALAPVSSGGFELLRWGSFSLAGDGQELAPHGDQLASGALGLADGAQLPSLPLLERGLSLAEMDNAPVLLSPRDRRLAQEGFVREGVAALRAGWPMDPSTSESLPLRSLLALAERYPSRRLQLMNLSTAEAVNLLEAVAPDQRPPATVCWWHLLVDSASLDPIAEGWRVEPPLGSALDRQRLKHGLRQGLISAVAVHHQALDPEEQLLPVDQRRPGVAGHRFVLPALWQELVQVDGWSAEELWQVLCFGPASLLGLAPPQLSLGTDRWLLFDPQQVWSAQQDSYAPLAANQPLAKATLKGQVLATGLNPQLWRRSP